MEAVRAHLFRRLNREVCGFPAQKGWRRGGGGRLICSGDGRWWEVGGGWMAVELVGVVVGKFVVGDDRRWW